MIPARADWRPAIGCDFSSAPSRRKPIVVAVGRFRCGVVRLDELLPFPTLDTWQLWLAGRAAQAKADGLPVVGGFDLPFGLPRELVQAQGWPLDWSGCMAAYAALSREAIRARFAAFCAARPVGAKFAHRATDGPAGSSPSMKWVNPPVAFMLHAGVPRLRAAGWHFAAHESAPCHAAGAAGPAPAVALEAYPALLARQVVGRQSYKADDAARQTPARARARQAIVAELCGDGLPAGWRLAASGAIRQSLIDEPQADRLDAVLCLMQAAVAASQPGYGLPASVDPLEGWIAGA